MLEVLFIVCIIDLIVSDVEFIVRGVFKGEKLYWDVGVLWFGCRRKWFGVNSWICFLNFFCMDWKWLKCICCCGGKWKFSFLLFFCRFVSCLVIVCKFRWGMCVSIFWDMLCEFIGFWGCIVIDIGELWEDWIGLGKDMVGVWFISLFLDILFGRVWWLLLVKYLLNKCRNYFVIEIFKLIFFFFV